LKTRIGYFISFVFLLITGFGWLFSSGSSSGIASIEKMFDRGFLVKLSTPEYTWLQNGKILMLDPRVEPEKRKFELLDPQSGQRKPIVDPAIIFDAFKKIFAKEAPKSLAWPDAVDSIGKRVVYILAGDLFMVDLEDSKVKRLTQTLAEEESVTFSPDNQWISFIRENDLYVIDVSTGAEKQLTTGSSDTLLNGKLSWV
jgi:Tol biopolymer transport system component